MLREQMASSVTLLQKIKSPIRAGQRPSRDSEGFAMLQKHWWVTLVIAELAFRRRNMTTKMTKKKIKVEVISSDDDESDDSGDKSKTSPAPKLDTGSSSSKATSNLVDEDEETCPVATNSCLSRLLALGHWKLGRPARCLPKHVTDEALDNMSELIYHVCHAYTEYAKVATRIEVLYQTRMLHHSESETLSHILRGYFSRNNLKNYAMWMPGKSLDPVSVRAANRRFVDNMDSRFLELQAPSAKGKADATAKSNANTTETDQDHGEGIATSSKKRRKRVSTTNEIGSEELDQELQQAPRWLTEFYDHMQSEVMEMSDMLKRVAETYVDPIGRLLTSLIALNSDTHASVSVSQAPNTSSVLPHPWYATPPYMPYHQSMSTSSSSSSHPSSMHMNHDSNGFHTSMPPGYHAYPMQYPYPPGSVHPMQYPGQAPSSYYAPNAHGFPYPYHPFMHPFGLQPPPSQPQSQPQLPSQAPPQAAPAPQHSSYAHAPFHLSDISRTTVSMEDRASDMDVDADVDGHGDNSPRPKVASSKESRKEDTSGLVEKSSHERSRKTPGRVSRAMEKPKNSTHSQDSDTEPPSKRHRQDTKSSEPKKQRSKRDSQRAKDKGHMDESVVEAASVSTEPPGAPKTATEQETNTRTKSASKVSSDTGGKSSSLARTGAKPNTNAQTSKSGDATKQRSSTSTTVGKPKTWKEGLSQACQLFEAKKAAESTSKTKPTQLNPIPSPVTSDNDEDVDDKDVEDEYDLCDSRARCDTDRPW